MWYLTPGQRRVLQKMLDGNLELDCERPGGWWLGQERVNGAIGCALVRLTLVSRSSLKNEPVFRYKINSEGRQALADQDFQPTILKYADDRGLIVRRRSSLRRRK